MQDLEEINHHTADDKIKWWGYGEWVEEPDEVRFTHEGIECRIIRVAAEEPNGHMFGGYLCGYVKVPEGHPFFGKGYDDIELDVHCGLTYSEVKDDNHYFLPKSGHWIGFDCAHSGDYVPSLEYLKRTLPDLIKIEKDFQDLKKHLGMKEDNPLFQKVYRNISFCMEECRSMAEQLTKVKVSG